MTVASHPDPTATGAIAAGATSAGTPGTITGIARSARPLSVLRACGRACATAADRGDRRKEVCDCGLTEDPPWCDGTCGN